MDDPWQLEADALLDRLEQEDRPPEFFHALRDLINKRYPRGRGRPKGHDLVDDDARLARLEELLRSGTDDEAAIKQVAVDDPGDDEKNTIKSSGFAGNCPGSVKCSSTRAGPRRTRSSGRRSRSR